MSSPTTLPDVETVERERLAPLFHVVLLDDNDHTYDYVVEMLERLFVMAAAEAFRHAVEVDSAGRTIVMTCGLAEAEYARQQIHSYGADWRLPRSKGSMSAVIEPAMPGE